MSISKRLRFEVLRRDSHTCRYCGDSAPDVKITIDHVVPVSLGGTDTAENLVAACVDCNGGKSSSQPDAEFVKQVEEDAFEWKRTVKDALRRESKEWPAVVTAMERFEEAWDSYCYDGDYTRTVKRDTSWRESFKTWIDLLTAGQMDDEECVDLALAVILQAIAGVMARKGIEDRWRYFCKVIWNKVREIQETNTATVEEKDDLRTSAHEVTEIEGGWFICSCGVPGCVAVRETIVARAREPYDPEAEDGWFEQSEDLADHFVWNDDGIIRCDCGDPYCTQAYIRRLREGIV